MTPSITLNFENEEDKNEYQRVLETLSVGGELFTLDNSPLETKSSDPTGKNTSRGPSRHYLVDNNFESHRTTYSLYVLEGDFLRTLAQMKNISFTTSEKFIKNNSNLVINNITSKIPKTYVQNHNEFVDLTRGDFIYTLPEYINIKQMDV